MSIAKVCSPTSLFKRLMQVSLESLGSRVVLAKVKFRLQSIFVGGRSEREQDQYW